MFQYHNLLFILAYGNVIVTAWHVLIPAIQNPAVPRDGIRGGDDAGLVLTRCTAVAAHVSVEVRKRRNRR